MIASSTSRINRRNNTTSRRNAPRRHASASSPQGPAPRVRLRVERRERWADARFVVPASRRDARGWAADRTDFRVCPEKHLCGATRPRRRRGFATPALAGAMRPRACRACREASARCSARRSPRWQCPGPRFEHCAAAAPLRQRADELRALGEAEGVEPAREPGLGEERRALLRHLRVHVAEVPVEGVQRRVRAHHDAVHVHPGDPALDEASQSAHRARVAAVVPH